MSQQKILLKQKVWTRDSAFYWNSSLNRVCWSCKRCSGFKLRHYDLVLAQSPKRLSCNLTWLDLWLVTCDLTMTCLAITGVITSLSKPFRGTPFWRTSQPGVRSYSSSAVQFAAVVRQETCGHYAWLAGKSVGNEDLPLKTYLLIHLITSLHLFNQCTLKKARPAFEPCDVPSSRGQSRFP